MARACCSPLQRLLWVHKHCLHIVENNCTSSQSVGLANDDSSSGSQTILPQLAISPTKSLNTLIAMPQSTLSLGRETDRPEHSQVYMLQVIIVQRIQPLQCTGVRMAATC